MADGAPAISRVQAGEDTLFQLLTDTDKRLVDYCILYTSDAADESIRWGVGGGAA